jgi:hypothetical protein
MEVNQKSISSHMPRLTCRHNMLTPEEPATSMIGFSF